MSNNSEIVDVEKLLTNVDAFINTMHVVRTDFNLEPKKEHIGTCINFQDLKELRTEFIEELIYTVTNYVYSKNEQQGLVNKFMDEGRDPSGAYNKIRKKSVRKFRSKSKDGSSSHLQGQFSEILLFNLLQHYFKATPLVRKMPITTNPEIERHGADAIHIGKDSNDNYILYIGEAKTYNRKKGGVKEALKDAVDDIINKHYSDHREELDLHVYEEHLPKELQEIGEGYLNGTLTEIEVHLVCIVTYDNKNFKFASNRKEILDGVINNIREDLEDVVRSKVFKSIPDYIKPRLNYIIFPVKDMNNLIELFAQELGG
ncbi:DUF1837 domain-containing protein [Priestia filamentosa]|uniref:HamA C-terminal domain-containing protein n=1 Tax=Priestia filamentosa TaxID=1402861 RepID=UPI001FB542A7|nr:DUF1837 domain-containing protein [Priestia filamentosa]UOE58279.1 DUF1837 domain-containing protein [Priestia filamentosa]